MAIYTRFGSEVTLCDARLIPVWVERKPSEIKWHYRPPNKVGKKSKISEVPFWHFRGWYTKDGKPVCDNKWVDANTLVADNGILEIQDKLDELCPDGTEKYKAWDKKGGPEASYFFPPVSTLDEVA